jgi:hypothetical protein
MATYTLWAINIVIPASVGALFILKAENPLLTKSSAIFRNPVNFRVSSNEASQSSPGLQTVTAIGHTSRQHAEI